MGATQSKKTTKRWYHVQYNTGRHAHRQKEKKGGKKTRSHGSHWDSSPPKLLGDQKQKEPVGSGEPWRQDSKKGHLDVSPAYFVPMRGVWSHRKLPRVTRLTSVHELTGDVVELYWIAKPETDRETQSDNPSRTSSSCYSRMHRSGLGDKNDCLDLANEFRNSLVRVSRWSTEEYDDAIRQQATTRNKQEGTDLEWNQQSGEIEETKL